MRIVLGADGPLIKPHEATALAALLAATDSESGRALAERLQRNAAMVDGGAPVPVDLSEDERQVLLQAIAEVPGRRAPRGLRKIRDALWDL